MKKIAKLVLKNQIENYELKIKEKQSEIKEIEIEINKLKDLEKELNA